MLNVVNIKAFDLPQAWFQCLGAVIQHGYEYVIEHGSFEGTKRKELDFVEVHITHPGTRSLIPFIPEGVPCPTSMEYVEQYLSYLMTSIKAPNEQYTYGEYIEPQMFKIIENYKKYGSNSNQNYITIGDQNSIDLTDPPCLRGIDTRIRYGKLHFMVYFRSWDLWGGFPSNMAALQLLKETMAYDIGVDDGELIASSKGLHLYDYTWDLAKRVCYL